MFFSKRIFLLTGIRRLIRELDEDARLYEYRRKQTLLQGPFSDRIEPSILELTDDEGM